MTSHSRTASRAPALVAHCIWDTSACGAQQVLRQLVGKLDRQRFASQVFTFHWGPIADQMVEQGHHVELLPCRSPKLDPTLILRLRRRLRASPFAVLHTHLFGASLHGLLAAAGLKGLAKVITLHNVREDNALQRLAYPLLFRYASRVVACSAEVEKVTREKYSERLGRKLTTIPNGIDVERFAERPARCQVRNAKGLPLDSAILIAIGRLTGQKNLSLLLRTLALLREDPGTLVLLIVGEGEERARLEQEARELGIEASVRFLGVRHDVPELLQAADLFVMSSLWEGLPMVLLEAMAAGVPCVSTAVGGIPEAVRDEEEALLVPPGDPAALAAAIRRALTEETESRARAARAYQRVRALFSAERMAEQYGEVYDQILA
jgi:glycosyltransferase involved in cell wall biosynthesis